MSGLLFGTAGVPHSAATGSTVDGILRIAELGLGCMELEFVQRVGMGEEAASLVAKAAAMVGVKLTAHAPYYINLNARDSEKVRASQQRIFHTARIGALCGAESIVFHAAFYMGDPPEEVYGRVKRYLAGVVNRLREEDIWVWLRPEIMGRTGQFGTIEEVLSLSAELEGVAPCIDFAHCHARSGGFNSYAEFASILERVEGWLGRAALDNMHIHVSGIDYGKKGEKRHLNLAESDFRYPELLKALKDYQVKGVVICESPNLEEDALLLQASYNALL